MKEYAKIEDVANRFSTIAVSEPRNIMIFQMENAFQEIVSSKIPFNVKAVKSDFMRHHKDYAVPKIVSSKPKMDSNASFVYKDI